MRKAFWAHGVHMRPLCEKPTLDEDDKKKRRAFVKKNKLTRKKWLTKVDAVLDDKTFQVYTHGTARAYAARRRVRAAYRGRAAKLTKGYTKPSKTLKYNTGARSVKISCAIAVAREHASSQRDVRRTFAAVAYVST